MKNIFLFIVLVSFFSDLSFAQYEVSVQIDASDNVNYIVIDPFGKKTGVDSRQTQQQKDWKWYEEIPHSNYGFQTTGSLDPNDSADVSMELMFGFNSPQADGDYIIKVFGWKTGLFDLYGGFNQDGELSSGCNFEIKKIPIEKDSTVVYKVSYHGDHNKLTSFLKIVDVTTLIRDVNAMQNVGWIQSTTTAQDYIQLYSNVGAQLSVNDIPDARMTLNSILNRLQTDSATEISSDAFKLLSADTRQLLNQFIKISTCTVKLVSSTGTKLTGGALQYYEGSWKDATNNNDGTFSVTTNLKTISLRMTYEYGTQTKSNVAISNDTIVFQTVNAQIQLQNSSGVLIDTGTVQYYAGAWRTLGPTINGITAKELLPANYSFRMTYAYASKDKQQDISANPIVVFQTVNAAVQLQNSQGTLMPAPLGDQGTVQYYSGAWRDFGTTSNGIANKELLANNYSFRMTYAYASKDKQQDLSTNSTVVFQTVNTAVQLQNSQGTLMPAPLGDQGTVQYYSGAWRDFGTTTNGVANKELLPNSYSFRMTSEYVSNDKQQDVSSNNTVIFSTVLCDVKVITLAGQLVNNATVSYYAGAWRQIGTTVNGEITKELLPANLSFRVKSGTVQQDKAQNISTNPAVVFTLQ